MSGSINSSGSQERYTLAAGEFKEYEVLKPGGTTWLVEVHGDEDQDSTGALSAVGTTVALQTAEAVAAVAASLTTNLTGATNNDLVFTAKSAGTAGNVISVAYSDPGGVTATASIAVVGLAITITLGRASSAVNTIANDIKALVAGFAPANALVTVADKASNDGTGLVAALSTTALAGGAEAGVGSYATVGSSVTVVPGGFQAISGATGRYAKILNSGTGPAHIVSKPQFRVQPRVSL